MLPRPMRGAASLGYLLARSTDTLADTAAAPVDARLLCLDWFAGSLSGGEDVPRWPISVLNMVTDPRERLLLEASRSLFAWLAKLPAAEAELVREVVSIIIGGQRLDLERFASASAEEPVALADDAALEDYTWRVAGCVGAFWTKLGFLTMGGKFSAAPADALLEMGIRYGKGLQLVNILRDLPADLRDGRCYLPATDPHDTTALLANHRLWVERAMEWVEAGFSYAETLRIRRLRAATVLPAMIARETLDRLRTATWDDLQTRVKVPRRRVYLALAGAMAGRVR